MKTSPISTSKSTHHSARPLLPVSAGILSTEGVGSSTAPSSGLALSSLPALGFRYADSSNPSQEVWAALRWIQPPMQGCSIIKEELQCAHWVSRQERKWTYRNLPTNTENHLGKLSGNPVNRMQSRINQNVVKFYSSETIRLYLGLTR